jgi:hypothetical protein
MLPMPNILEILREYLMNLTSIRTQVGSTLAWNLPLYKFPLNEKGERVDIEPDQLFKLPLLKIYEFLK